MINLNINMYTKYMEALLNVTAWLSVSVILNRVSVVYFKTNKLLMVKCFVLKVLASVSLK